MMGEWQYKIEFDKTFIQVPTEDNNYKRKMILQNQIPGLLSCKLIYEGQFPYLCYEVTGKKSLQKKYDYEKIEFKEMDIFFSAMIEIMKKSREYLLEARQFCLEPENIYFDIETEEMSLLYNPNHRHERGKQYRELAEFLLDKVNHKDEHAVKIAYQFYKLSKEEFFSLESFQSFIEKEMVMHENREKDLEKKKDLPNIENITNNNINEVIPIEKKKKKNMFTIFRRRKEKQQEEELKAAEYTTIDDYFGEEVDCETIFFDTELVLKWKEKGFSKEYTLSDFPI